jgi:PspA-Associated protein
MIVRISGEDQYRLDDDTRARVNELENAVVQIVDSRREDGFADAYAALLDYVRAHGQPLGEEEIEPSDVILPPADLTFAEAGREFTGEGLIPD